LNFNEGDEEQLSNFMGHSKEIHKSFYRLPDSVFQIAKISKFLLMMEKGEADQYRGKNFDDIDVNVEGLISEDSDNENSDSVSREITMKVNRTQNQSLLNRLQYLIQLFLIPKDQ